MLKRVENPNKGNNKNKTMIKNQNKKWAVNIESCKKENKK